MFIIFSFKMPIVFSAVACDRNIVADFASCDGNFTEIAEQVLSKLPPCNNKMTYSHGMYLLHYIARDDTLYFCITDKLCQRSRAFLFLNEIQRRFISSKQINDFADILAAEMYRYSEDYSTIEIRKGELDEINGISVGCSESILGEKILYINNPDVISYGTITNVASTPGIISVLVESTISEGISAISPTIDKVWVQGPILDRISDNTPTLERTAVKSSTPERTLVIHPFPKSGQRSVEESTPITEKTPIRNLTPDKMIAESPTLPTSEKTATESLTLERTSVRNLTPEGISVRNLTPKKMTVENPTLPTLEEPAIKTLTLERTLERNLTPEKMPVENLTPEITLIKSLTEETVVSPESDSMTAITSPSETILGDSPNSQVVSGVTPNKEIILSEGPTADRITDMSPRLYMVVIIGMIILVISMLVYAFGPISCAIVTGVGIYSLFKSYVDSKDKSE